MEHKDDQHPADGQGLQAMRNHLRQAVHHTCHMLSEQCPMNITFVHNNTLLGLQAMHFDQAVVEAERVLGGRGYLPSDEYRALFKRGRINQSDVDRSLKEIVGATLDEVIVSGPRTPLNKGSVYPISMIHGLNPIDPEQLSFEVSEGRATYTFRADVPAPAREAILKKSAVEWSTSIARVTQDWTLSHWLQAHLNLDLVGPLRRQVLRQLSSDAYVRTATDADLGLLAIPTDRWLLYRACIDRMFEAEIKQDIALRGRIQALWLQAEVKQADIIARRHFGIPGNLRAIQDHFTASPDHFAVSGLWSAALYGCGLDDPFSPTDPNHLQEQDAVIDRAEMLAELASHMERWGGPPVPLSASLGGEIERVVKLEIDDLRLKAKDGDGAATEQAHLCWIVLHDLGERHLNRRGLEALETLLSLHAEKEGYQQLLETVRELDPRHAMMRHIGITLDADISMFQTGRTHSDFLARITGYDPVERVNAYMIRICSAFVDEGLAAWHMPARALGFYDAWRNYAQHDRSFDLDGLPGWREALHKLPTLADDAVIHQLLALGVPEADWSEYLGRMLARLKGWAAMTFWYELHPAYGKQAAQPIDPVQYLAVRLFYESLLVRKAFKSHWQINADVASIKQYFSTHPAQYFVARELYAGKMSDSIAATARDVTSREGVTEAETTNLADLVWADKDSQTSGNLVADRVWCLFHLAQFLGFSAGDVRALSAENISSILGALDAFPEREHRRIWLAAYERHYRDELLNGLTANRGRGRWRRRDSRPKSQLVLCIDEREENLHRHYEELDPGHETLGAAGFFGVAMDYFGLDDHDKTPLCPAVATPGHRIFEVARPEAEHTSLPMHKKRAKWMDVFNNTYWETKRNLVASYFLIDLVGFLMALPLIGRVFAPVGYFAAGRSGYAMLVPDVETRLTVTRPEYHNFGAGKPVGFTDVEQADRIEAMLRNTGLTYQFARIVIWCAHGSNSQNNPHENAHDCGACGGKHGAPNARAFAAMANRPQTRVLLRQRGIDIPDDTWLVGAEHNTASDVISYYDVGDIPAALRADFNSVCADLEEASKRGARERCRRFASSPKDASLDDSLHHVKGRATDFSQVRPEWGHATNACAVVGRRAITQGIFLDRRPFIISYDPTQETDGKFLERILLAVGPVGAGINLEYYFSTVDTKVYGSDTKVPHNVTGMIGIMEGAHSDLRTGLPAQMTEVHEAMRLQLIVDAKMETLGEIYGRQPAIQQLLNGQWVHLIAHDPDTGEFNMFVPGVGFVKWDEPLSPIPEVASSYDWHRGKYQQFLSPALITEPKAAWTESRGAR